MAPPLDGLRVLDLSQVWSGPLATRILGDLGAEVIKVEAVHRPDPERGPIRASPGTGTYPQDDPGDEPYNRSGRFVEYNRNKYGITLNLATDKGLSLFKRLVGLSDVVIENFSVGVMDRLGLGYPQLRDLKPDIIMLSMPAFGATGPEKGFVAFGPQQECLTGLAGITGYEPQSPLVSWVFYPDPTVALFAVSAILTAIWHRSATGAGQHIELAQREAVIFALPEVVLERTIAEKKLTPANNQHPRYAPHGCYRCLGDDAWVAIAVRTDDEWRALCRCMDRKELADDSRFATSNSRLDNRSRVNGILEAWTRQRDHYEVMRQLQASGIPAGAVLNMAEMLTDEHYADRGFFIPIEYSAGVGQHPSLGFPWRFSATPASVRMPTPRLGEHTPHVLGNLLGLSDEEVRALERQGIIGTIPHGVAGSGC